MTSVALCAGEHRDRAAAVGLADDELDDAVTVVRPSELVLLLRDFVGLGLADHRAAFAEVAASPRSGFASAVTGCEIGGVFVGRLASEQAEQRDQADTSGRAEVAAGRLAVVVVFVLG